MIHSLVRRRADKLRWDMPRKTTTHLVVNGRPSDYSDDLLNKICELIQSGATFREISMKDGMPHFTTLSNWRRTRPEFFYALKAVEEDMVREDRRTMRNTANKLVEAASILSPAGVLENYSAVKAAVDSLDKVSKVKVTEGDAPMVDDSTDIEDQRRRFDDLHPLTQDKIRLALLEDQRLREGGDEEDPEA